MKVSYARNLCCKCFLMKCLIHETNFIFIQKEALFQTIWSKKGFLSAIFNPTHGSCAYFNNSQIAAYLLHMFWQANSIIEFYFHFLIRGSLWTFQLWSTTLWYFSTCFAVFFDLLIIGFRVKEVLCSFRKNSFG